MDSKQPFFFNDYYATPKPATLGSSASVVKPSSAINYKPPFLPIDEYAKFTWKLSPAMAPSLPDVLDASSSKSNPTTAVVIQEHEYFYLVLSALGFWLNLVLFFATIFFKRHDGILYRYFTQRLFVIAMAFGNFMFCASHIVELSVLTFDTQITALAPCIRVLHERGVAATWQILVIASIFSCAVDNYIAICKPAAKPANRRRNLRSDNVTNGSAAANCASILGVLLITVVAIVCSLISLYSATNLESNCLPAKTKPSSSIYGTVKELFSSVPTLQRYCHNVLHCQTSVVEKTIIGFWGPLTIACIFLFSKTIAVLRVSLKRLSFATAFENASTVLVSQTHQSNASRYNGGEFGGGHHASTCNPSGQRLSSSAGLPGGANRYSRRCSNNVKRLSEQRQHNEFAFGGTSSAASAPSNRPGYVEELNILNDRSRLINSLVFILACFVITGLPEVSLQFAIEFVFTSRFRQEIMPNFLRYSSHLRLLLVINAVIEPLVYGRLC